MSRTKHKTTKTNTRGVGSVARKAIIAGKTNEQALSAVMKAFPKCSSNLSCMSWYRADLRRKRTIK